MRLLGLAAIVLLSLLSAALGALAQSDPPATPASPSNAAAATPVMRGDATLEILANPVGTPAVAENATMVLYRITLPPGTTVERHLHDDAAVWYIESGTLRLTVESGEVWVRCRGGCRLEDAPTSRTEPDVEAVLREGETVTLNPTDWIVQYESTSHSYQTGDSPVIIVASAVYSDDKPGGCRGGCM